MSQDNVWEWLLEQSVFQLLLKSRQRIGRRDIVRKPVPEQCCCDRKHSTDNGINTVKMQRMCSNTLYINALHGRWATDFNCACTLISPSVTAIIQIKSTIIIIIIISHFVFKDNYRSNDGIIYELLLAKSSLGVISSLCVADMDFIIHYLRVS